MLNIKFSPQDNNLGQQTITWTAPVLTINGIDYDLSLIGDETGFLNGDPPIIAGERSGDNYSVVIILNHCGMKAPHETRFPQAVQMTKNGTVPVPPYTGV